MVLFVTHIKKDHQVSEKIKKKGLKTSNEIINFEKIYEGK